MSIEIRVYKQLDIYLHCIGVAKRENKGLECRTVCGVIYYCLWQGCPYFGIAGNHMPCGLQVSWATVSAGTLLTHTAWTPPHYATYLPPCAMCWLQATGSTGSLGPMGHVTPCHLERNGQEAEAEERRGSPETLMAEVARVLVYYQNYHNRSTKPSSNIQIKKIC